MPSLNVVETAIIAFSNHGRQSIVGNTDLGIARDHPIHHPVCHSRHVQGIGESDRILEEARFTDPSKPRHFASSIEDERPGRYFLVPDIVARDDDCHTSSYGTKPRLKWSFSGDTGGLAHGDA